MKHRRHTIPRHPISRPNVIPFVNPNRNTSISPTSPITPQTVKTAYSFPKNTDLSGLKIACIEAFYNDTLHKDLEIFCRHFGIKPPTLKIHYPFGKSAKTNSQWIYESSLDVQWLSALCDKAQINVLFSPTSDIDYMTRCALYAADTLKCHIVLMSFGTGEFLSQSEISESFRNRRECIFVSAAGDTGGKVFFPSSSSAVLSVGGSTVALGDNGLKLGKERAWRFGGGGASKYESIPPYQRIFESINQLSGGFRATPDVCFYADFAPGVPIYASSDALSKKGWSTSGGTSFSSVALAGVCAHIKKSTPKALHNSINSYFYALAGGTKYDLPQYYFNDITSGSNTVYSAKIGWDFCTGLGSPISKQLTLG